MKVTIFIVEMKDSKADEFILSKAIFNDLAFMEYKIDVSDNDWFVRSMCKLESFCY